MTQLRFLPVLQSNDHLCSPCNLFNPSNPLLQDLFKGQPVFPLEPFRSVKCLDILTRFCGLKKTVSPQDIIDVILEIGVLGKEILSADKAKFTRAKALLKFIQNWDDNTLSQSVTLNNDNIKLSQAFVTLAHERLAPSPSFVTT